MSVHNYVYSDFTGLVVSDPNNGALQAELLADGLIATTADSILIDGPPANGGLGLVSFTFTPDLTGPQATQLTTVIVPAHTGVPLQGEDVPVPDSLISQSSVTQHEGAINHDALLNYVVGQHRVINDAGTGTTDLWSASKINSLVSAATQNLDLKDSVRTVATANITLSGEQTLNGVLTSTSRVGVVGQSAPAENGIYVSSAGAWTRATDADVSAEVTQGLSFFVAEGTKQGFQYILVTADPITLGATSLSFIEVKRVEFGTTSGTATEGNDSRVPSQDENDALLGTDGTPSNSNRYVTNSDPRNTDSRTPTGSASGDLTGTYPGPTIANSAVTNAKQADMAANTAKVNATASPAAPQDLAIGTNTVLGRQAGNIVAATVATAQIANDAVTNAKLANMAANTAKVNATAGSADPADLAVGTNTVIGRVAGNIVAAQLATGQVADNAIDNTKIADMANATIKGRTTAGTGDPEDLTATQARAILNVADGANNYSHPNHTGDVTSVGDGAQTIAANAVTNAKAAQMAQSTLKGRAAGAGTGDPQDLTATQARTLLNVADGANNYSHPNHTGDVTSIGDGAQTIAANAVTNAKAAQMPANTAKVNATAGTADAQDLAVGTNTVLGRVAGNIVAAQLATAQIANNAVTNAKLAQVATATFKGRTTGGTGDPEDLTATQATALLNVFTSSLKGLAPSSGGGTTNFLRADATWATPPGSGGQKLYDAIVAPSGGDYTLPSAAFSAGHTRVWVRAGTYVETANVVIPNGGALHGENGVALVMGAFQVRCDGQLRKTVAGTLSVTNGSTTVTGTGTAFNTLLAGDWIAIGPDFFEIASTPVSATSLTLVQPWRGKSTSGLPVLAQRMFRGVTIRNIAVVNSTHVDGGLFLRGVIDSLVAAILVSACTLNINLVDSGNMGLVQVAASHGGSDGLRFTGCRSVAVADGHFWNNTTYGVNVTGAGGGISIKFDTCEFTANGSNGATVQGTAQDVSFDACGSKYNQGKGFNTEPTTVRCVIDGCTVQFNNGVGIDVDGTQNVVSNSQIGNGNTDGIFCGVSCKVSDNFVHNNAGVGISLNGDSNTTVVGNTCQSNTGTGIASTTSNDCVVTNNRLLNNGGWGISIAASSDRTRVGSNVFSGNTLGTITDAATTTVYVDNICTTVAANSAITTTSTTHILATGMSITPPRGTYAVFWAAAVSTNSDVNRHAYIQIYAGGVAQGSEIGAQRSDSSTDNEIGISTFAKVTVNGSQAIEGRWRTSASTGEMYGRSLMIVQVA